MNSYIKGFFEPLPREYCNYFYFLSLFFALIFVIAIISTVFGALFNYKKFNLVILLNMIIIMLNALLAYFVNRLFYSMCIKSI
jgi:hypothetical protein